MKKNNWRLDRIIEGMFVVVLVLFVISLLWDGRDIAIGVAYGLTVIWFLLYISMRDACHKWRDLYFQQQKSYEEALRDMGDNNKLLAGQIAKYKTREKETDQSS